MRDRSCGLRRGRRPSFHGPAWLSVTCVSFLLIQACSTDTWSSGSPEGDLRALRAALDATIVEARLNVPNRTLGVSDAACIADGPPLRHATETVAVDLQGEDATEVSARIADVWDRHKDDWFGGGLEVNDTKVSNPGYARVGLTKGGWALAAAVPDNRERGQFEVTASAPCR